MSHPNRRPLTAEEQQSNRRPNVSHSAAAALGRADTNVQAHETNTSSELHIENVSPTLELPPASQAGPQLGTPPPAVANNLHWITSVNDLTEFKNRDTMRAGRSHVMHEYLANKQPAEPQPKRSRTRARSNDSQGTSSTGTPGAQGLATSSEGLMTDNDYALSLYRKEPKSKKRRLSSPDTKTSAPLLEPGLALAGRVPTTSPALELGAVGEPSSPKPLQLLVPRLRSSIYHTGHQGSITVKYPMGSSAVDPFKTLPVTVASDREIFELKHHCSHVFGSQAMNQFWVPALMQSSHSFLSTVCISSIHMDAMKDIEPSKGHRTIGVRAEVIRLINKNLNVDDLTIMAVLQLMTSDIVSDDTKALQWHGNGILQMVEIRGGLNELKVEGQLASLLTIQSFQIAILRGDQPHPMYTEYFERVRRPHYANGAVLPESPLFCPRANFHTLRKSPHARQNTLQLLRTLQQLTSLFIGDSSSLDRETTFLIATSGDAVGALCDSILSLPSANSVGGNDRLAWIFEACQLAGVIYATSLKRRIEFSKAVASLEQSSMSASSASSSSHTASLTPGFLLKRLKRALKKAEADFSCWDDMTGVLFWVALVGGTAAKDRPENNSERRWFAAVAVRCSILLAFEHGYAVMQSLRTLLKVTETLQPPQTRVE